MYLVVETKDYNDWLQTLTLKEQAQVNARISRIRINEHFGVAKKLDQNLAELKWSNGKRIYFAITSNEFEKIIILLLGGNKNSQTSDIKRAKKLINLLKA
jgi:putative addiction module killer protein